MGKITYLFIIIFLIGFNFILIFSLFKKKQNISLIINEINTMVQIEQDYYANLKQRMFLSHKYESDSICFDEFEKNNQYYLILRYPKLACTTCMDSLLYYLSYNFSENELNNNVIILADGSHQQYIFQLKRFHSFNFPKIIETNKSMQILPLDSLDLPYFFILNSNNCVNIFIPEKDKPLETKEYISLIRKKYFHKRRAT